MAEETWSKIEGMVIAGSLDPLQVAEEFKQESVVASLVWYDESPELVGIILAAKGGRLATLAKRGKVIRTGPTVEHMARRIAEKFDAEVMLGDVQVDHFVAAEEEAAPAEVEGEDKAPELPIRVVEISATPPSAIPLLAAFEGVDVAELPHDEERRVLLAQVPSHRSGWHFGDPPLVRLTVQGDEFHAHYLPHHDPEAMVTYNWGMNEVLVAGAKGWEGPTPESVQDLVGCRNDILAIHDAVPGVDAEAAFEATQMRGSAAVTKFVRALGLAPEVAEFLLGWLSVEQVPDATVHQARGISNAIGRSVDILLEERRGEPHFWDKYKEMVRSKPWMVRAFAATQVTVAGALLFAGRRRDGARTLGGKVATGAAALLLLYAAADTTLARLTADREERLDAEEELAAEL